MTSRKRKKTSKSDIEMLLLCMPVLIKVFIFSYLPMAGIIIAFKNLDYQKGIFRSEFVGFKNFEFFFKSVDCFRITKNTLVMNGIFIITGLVISVLFALVLYRVSHNKIMLKSYQTIMFFPYFLSWVVVGILLDTIIGNSGLLNNLLKAFGLDTISFYREAAFWPYILTFVYLWKMVGYNCIIYYALLIGIDASQYESARIDGANDFQIMIKIQIPYLIPMMVLNVILASGNIFRADFGLFYFLPGSSNTFTLSTTDVIDTYVFRAVKDLGNMSMSAAVGVYQSVVGFILVMITNYLAKRYDSSYKLF